MKVVTRKKVFDHGHGLEPGQLIKVEDYEAPHQVTFKIMAYGPDDFREVDNASLDDVREHLGQWAVCWIHVCGISDEKLIRQLCEILGVHNLATEEMLNTQSRPKFEEYGEDLFVVSKSAQLHEDSREIHIEQVAFFAGQNVFLSVQESHEDIYTPVFARARDARARLRQRGTGYLLFALMDVKSDCILTILDMMEADIVVVEEDLLREDNETFSIEEIYRHKRAVLAIMRFVLPMRDNAHRLEIIDHPLIHEEDRYFYRDLADSTRRAADRVEHSRLILQNMQEYYHLIEERKNNRIMKVLTIIATLFLPLTFIAGVYGMNFDHEVSPWNMPELFLYFGYPLCLAFMATFFFGMLLWFRKRRWI